MRISRFIAALVAAIVALPLAAVPASAILLIQINKATQQMTVSRDGELLYVWPVSTGRAGMSTPSGSFTPFRMDIDHYSVQYDHAPMPHSIFFTRTGDAIHGTFEEKWIGHAVSHGCVRLSRAHAAILWDLVKQQKMANTKVVLNGHIPLRGDALALARRALQQDKDIAARGFRRNWNNQPVYYDNSGHSYYREPPPPASIPSRRDNDDDGPLSFFFGQ